MRLVFSASPALGGQPRLQKGSEGRASRKQQPEGQCGVWRSSLEHAITMDNLGLVLTPAVFNSSLQWYL